MSVNFEKIRWKNILSTGNVFTEVNFQSAGTTLIVGINGAGKSTILDVLTFALFGKPFRNINKPQLVNTINKKDAVVELEFHANSNQYKIIRGMKPNIFEVYCNEILVNQSADIRDYQEILEKHILRINYKSFCQVVILGSASFVPFMQLPTGRRREIIEDLLDLEVFTTMNTLLKDKLQVNQQELLDAEYQKDLVEQKIDLVKQHLEDLRKKNDEFVKQKKQSIKDIEKKLNYLNCDSIELMKRISDKENNIEDINAVQKKLEKLKSLHTQITVRSEQLRKEMEFFTKHDTCPTCQQSIDEQFKCTTIDDRSNQIKEIESGLEKLIETYNDTDAKLRAIFDTQKEINNDRSSLFVINSEIANYRNQIETLTTEIKQATKKVKDSSDDKMEDLQNEQLTIASNYNRIQEDKHVLSAASSMLKDGGIKTKIINQYIPVINKLINKYLAEFDLFCEFQLDDQFNETIKSRYRDAFTYSSFSEGEKQKIDLAVLFTWRAIAKLRNSLSTNLLILDEVFDSSLDGNAADDLLKIINSIAKDSNVFIISHREQLFEKFDNTIKFVKNKNFSSIEV